MKRLVVVVLMLAAAALIGACGHHEAPSPTATPTAPTTATAIATVATSTAPPATPTPVATATPVPTATAVPTPPTAGLVVEHGSRSSGMVALTFDMGGRVDPALDIVTWLIDHRVHATIFMTGAMVDNVNTSAGRDVLALVSAHPELFALGNHSYSHPEFRDLTAAEMRDELARTEASIARYVDVSPRPLFRPPFGGQNATVVQAVAAAGYPYTVLWDVDTIDWNPESDGGPTTADIVQKVTDKVQGGSIVLMHLGGYHTYGALPSVVAAVQSAGLEPVTLTTLLAQ